MTSGIRLGLGRESRCHVFLSTSHMIFVIQTSTGTMVKRVPQEQMFVIEATLLENHFLPSSGFVMLMSVEDVLIS